MGFKRVHREAPLRADNSWIGKDGLDEGLYKDAAQAGLTVSMALEEMRAEKRGEDSPYMNKTKAEVLAVRRDMKREGKVVPMTAFEEALWMGGIKAFGSNSDAVSKFFELSDVDVLFPEYVADRIYSGMLMTGLVGEFSMGMTVLDSTNYWKIYLESTEDARQMREAGKNDEFPTTKIKVGKQSVRLTKVGRVIEMSYEDVKFQRLNMFGAFLAQIGLQMDIDRTDDMFYILKNGDGNSNTPETTVESTTGSSITTPDVIKLATGAPSPYKFNKFAGKKALLQEYLNILSNFDNPVATWGFMGIDLPRSFEWNRDVMTADEFIAVDQRFAVEHLTTGAVMTEVEKLIRKQITGTVVSHADAFSIFAKQAVGIFDKTH